MCKIIPKIIHYVWISSLPTENQLKYIDKCARTNSDYRVFLWYDSDYLCGYELKSELRSLEERMKTNTAKISEYLDVPNVGGYIDKAKSLAASSATDNRAPGFGGFKHGGWNNLSPDARRLVLIQHLRGNTIDQTGSRIAVEFKRQNLCKLMQARPRNVEFQDIRRTFAGSGAAGLMPYTLEAANRGGNCPAASDLVRLEVLSRYGGIYMDVDIEPVEKFGDIACDKNLALFCLGKAEETPKKSLQMSDLPSDFYFYFYNAVIACHPSSALIDACRETIFSNYSRAAAYTLTKEALKHLFTSASAKRFQLVPNKFTIETTGPNMVREQVFLKFQASHNSDIKINDHLRSKTLKHDEGFAPFWKWFNENCRFPEQLINIDTEEQKDSATKALVMKVNIGDSFSAARPRRNSVD